MYQIIVNEIREGWHHAGFQKYFKNTSWALLGKIFSLGVSFITSIYVIRHLGPDNYGLLTFSISFVSLFAFAAALGLDSILYRELSHDLSKKNELLGTSLFLKIIASIVTIALILISINLIKTEPLTKLLIVINSFTLFFGSFTVIGYFFQANVQAKYQAISLITVTIVLNTLKVLVIFFGKGIIYFAFVFFLEHILYAVMNFYFYARSGNSVFNWTVKKDTAIALLKDSWPLMLSTASIVIYTRIDQVILKFTTNNFNVGIYDAAAKISEVWYFIPAIIIGSIFPAIINSKKVSTAFFKERLVKLYSLLFYMSLVVALPITLFSNSIITAVYGTDFIQAAGILSIYIWAGIPVFISMALNTYLLAENKTLISFTSSAVGMIANVFLNLLLIPKYGVNGAAFATLISYSLVPLSAVLFKSTHEQAILIKDGIMYPYRWFIQKIWMHQ